MAENATSDTMFNSSCQATQAHGGQKLFIPVPDVGHVKALHIYITAGFCYVAVKIISRKE